jgi:DNA-binding SARP family transcriptional activator
MVIRLEPWWKQAYRRVGRALALRGGRRTAAAQFEVLCSILGEGLGRGRADESEAVLEQIRRRVPIEKVNRA